MHHDTGYGSMEIANVLWFGDSESGFHLQVFQNLELEDDSFWEKCILNVNHTRALKVSIVWTDPPPFENTKYALVNDLDLVLEKVESGERMYGNTKTSMHDRVNNNEQIVWETPDQGLYRVLVFAYNIPTGAQNFSVVITGTFTLQTGACSSASLSPCSVHNGQICGGNGECTSSGVCACNVSHYGTDCSMEIEKLRENHTSVTPVIGVNQWFFYSVPPDLAGDINITATPTFEDSDPDFYVAQNRTPTLIDFDLKETSRYFHNKLNLTLETLHQTDLILGIFVYCCKPTQLQITPTRTTLENTENVSTRPALENTENEFLLNKNFNNETENQTLVADTNISSQYLVQKKNKINTVWVVVIVLISITTLSALIFAIRFFTLQPKLKNQNKNNFMNYIILRKKTDQ